MGLEDFMRPQFPLVGLPIADLTAALAHLELDPEVDVTRILKGEARHDGHLLVQTGVQSGSRAGAGKCILLRRTDHGWTVMEVGSWRS